MKQIKVNSFRDIVLDDLEHIILNEVPRNNKLNGYNVSTFQTPSDLCDYTFKKKYNLIYQNDTMDEADDLKFNRKSTEVLKDVFAKNIDKFFLIIDNGVFDQYTLSSIENCQIWPRKYFSTAFCRNHQGSANNAVIQKDRKHWFCSILGRNDLFRSMMFDWIIDNGLEKQNKVSYLAYSPTNLRDINDVNENHESQDIRSRHKNLIPFNNFEGKDEIPVNEPGRMEKVMPLYDCLFNLVMETNNVESYPYLTEKTGNTILYGHIPIIIGGSGSMKKLQDMGIIVPDYIKWHMWDDLPIDQSNYSKIDVMQRQLTKLFENNKINDIAEDWYPYAKRNFNKFLNIENDCAEEEKEICRWILTSTHNLKNKKYQYLYAQ